MESFKRKAFHFTWGWSFLFSLKLQKNSLASGLCGGKGQAKFYFETYATYVILVFMLPDRFSVSLFENA